MKKTYKKIEFGAGENIDSAVNILKRYKINNELAYGLFNGIELYSDIDDIDSAYKKVTGKTKDQYNHEEQKWLSDYEEQNRKHKEAIPSLTEEWIEKGSKILDEKYMELWVKIIPIRLNDLYNGMELGACLEIIAQLNNGCDLKQAKKIIEDQGHSGMSFGLVCSMVNCFCDRGPEFIKFIK